MTRTQNGNGFIGPAFCKRPGTLRCGDVACYDGNRFIRASCTRPGTLRCGDVACYDGNRFIRASGTHRNGCHTGSCRVSCLPVRYLMPVDTPIHAD